MDARRFHLSDILSVTTGHLVSTRHIDGVYDILNFMTGDNVYTHQIPRVMDECRPWLVRQHPQLAPTVDQAVTPEQVHDWLAAQIALLGESLDILPIPRDAHAVKDPIAELREMAPHATIIPIVRDEE